LDLSAWASHLRSNVQSRLGHARVVPPVLIASRRESAAPPKNQAAEEIFWRACFHLHPSAWSATGAAAGRAGL